MRLLNTAGVEPSTKLKRIYKVIGWAVSDAMNSDTLSVEKRMEAIESIHADEITSIRSDNKLSDIQKYYKIKDLFKKDGGLLDDDYGNIPNHTLSSASESHDFSDAIRRLIESLLTVSIKNAPATEGTQKENISKNTQAQEESISLPLSQ